MVIKFKNQFKKGDLLPLTVEENRVIVHSITSANIMDITDIIGEEDIQGLRKVGRGYATVLSNEEVSICYFAQLHAHSEYSILDGMSKIKDIAAKSSGITAITDHGNMFGMLKFQTTMHKAGKKSIIGCEVYCENVLDGKKNGCHLILLAKNEQGKKNLFELCSMAYDNFYKKPHIKIEDLKNLSEGLVCTSACMGGEVARAATVSYDLARKVAEQFKEIFGDDYYLELQRHGINNERTVNSVLCKISKDLNIKLVATNDSHYVDQADAERHEVLLCLNQHKTLKEAHMSFEGTGYHYMTDYEMVRLFWDMPEAIANTLEVADKCTLEIETGVYHLPSYPLPKGYASEDEYLKNLIAKGFEERYSGTPAYNDHVYRERLEYETEIILKMGFSAYFLIVQDYVMWAKNRGILVGPGRGSAAGSLVAYCLKITDLDPIQHDLLFERFLNPDRISMPDIDMDFEDGRRAEVINYVREKYGSDRVCNIITFGKLQAKVVLQDTARVLDAFGLGVEAKKAVADLKISEAVETQAVKDFRQKGNLNEQIFQIAEKLEGNVRQTGVHACGIIVSDKTVRSYVPTLLIKDKKAENEDEQTLVAQVEMTEAEELGLLKMDFLGLVNMSIIGNTISQINPLRINSGLKEISYYREITITDPYVYLEFSKGTSFAVFQIESEGMRSFMVKLFSDVKERVSKIEAKYGFKGYGEFVKGNGRDKDGYMSEMQTFGKELFERMIAGVSLYRPGPMDYIPDYIKGMTAPNEIIYDVPELEPILKNTYGVIVYQEQVMQIVRELAGFTMGQSDTVRKAMGKKKQEILDEYKPYFLSGSGEAVDDHSGKKLNIVGCTGKGIDKEIAEKIWDKMKEFAKYAFNKSHAAVYAVITVTCGWLKTYYPLQYMTAVLNSYSNNNEKLKGYMAVVRRLGINLLPPDINSSTGQFSVEGDSIRFGFCALNGISKTANVVSDVRSSEGEFKDFNDTVKRLYVAGLNKKALECLIKSGAMDCLGETRRSMADALEECINRAKKDKKRKENDESSGQFSFLEEIAVAEDSYFKISKKTEFEKSEKLRYEKETAGIYLSEHPLDEFKDTVNALKASEIAFLTDDEGNLLPNDKTTVVGIITDYRVLFTKKDNRPMATITLEDTTGSIKVVVFPNDFENVSSLIEKNRIVVVKGKVSSDDFGNQILCETLIDIKDARDSIFTSVLVRLEAYEDYTKLYKLLNEYADGDVKVYMCVRNSEKTIYDTNYTVKATSGLLMGLKGEFGDENVLAK